MKSSEFVETRRSLCDDAAMRVEAAVARAPVNYRTEEVLTPALQILIPVRGVFAWQLGTSESLLTANHALFIHGGDVSRDRFVDPHPVEYLLITPRLDPLAAQPDSQATEALVRGIGTRRVACSGAALQRAASMLWHVSQGSTAADPAELEETIARLWLEILRLGSAEPARSRRSASKLVREAKEIIGAGRERLSLAQIAAQVGTSPGYLTHAFREHEGITIAKYQRRLRLAQALAELPHTRDLTALALELGFSSHAHFSTAFRATYGETPSAYRARMRRR
ncbi:MAG: helix-turn-helix transcriptional regulator [Steroidobacteraceae bacterium]|nr:helix-turn-helix transcriptional regulator [Steroidobacteraceae bacterium]